MKKFICIILNESEINVFLIIIFTVLYIDNKPIFIKDMSYQYNNKYFIYINLTKYILNIFFYALCPKNNQSDFVIYATCLIYIL